MTKNKKQKQSQPTNFAQSLDRPVIELKVRKRFCGGQKYEWKQLCLGLQYVFTSSS